MSEIVAMFFDGSFEGSITEKMLNYSYDFPTAKLEDYVITVIATPYKEFVGFVSEYLCPKKIDDSSQIPQTSSYELSTFGVCNAECNKRPWSFRFGVWSIVIPF